MNLDVDEIGADVGHKCNEIRYSRPEPFPRPKVRWYWKLEGRIGDRKIIIIIIGLQVVCRDPPPGDVGVAIGARCHGRPSPDYCVK